jgi:outer membrane protein OmpA-like peptidoglycan-associated protein
MRQLVIVVAVAAIAAGSSIGCASKGFVKDRVGEVNDKVESISKSLEETQERTKKNEAAIAEANQKIVQVDQRATAGVTAANAAAANAKSAADVAVSKAEAVEEASKRIVYEVTISEDQGNFRLGQASLPEEAKARIDEVVAQLKANPNGAYIEVEGHTDNTGAKEYNDKLALERAEAVKRYLYEEHEIPLHRISVIGYGPDKPAASNATRDGRAKNRRVVIKVLV